MNDPRDGMGGQFETEAQVSWLAKPTALSSGRMWVLHHNQNTRNRYRGLATTNQNGHWPWC